MRQTHRTHEMIALDSLRHCANTYDALADWRALNALSYLLLSKDDR